VLITGDIADNIQLLPDTLSLINGLSPPLGTFAILGNHEHFRGIGQVREMFSQSPVPLFVNEGTHCARGETSLFIGGVDDPRTMGADHREFFTRAVDAALQESLNDEFKILMSHRPDAFDYAADCGVRLTLAGHTHGGQVGWFGRSLFERLSPESYLWGDYRKGSSHLYTTSGVGHWFPFRLGCPQEAPIIELKRA
jgi:predicted MPP superfamily phosphohydrolase